MLALPRIQLQLNIEQNLDNRKTLNSKEDIQQNINHCNYRKKIISISFEIQLFFVN